MKAFPPSAAQPEAIGIVQNFEAQITRVLFFMICPYPRTVDHNNEEGPNSSVNSFSLDHHRFLLQFHGF